MPRKARIDAPGALHHIIFRGIERRKIFADDRDRNQFLKRLGKVLTEADTPCYAWALMPNHGHLLAKTGNVSLSTVMQRLLGGHAAYFNSRHSRHGKLFQNRFKSILCQEETYLLELVRYIHLNPLRARLVANMAELDRYAYSGHSTLVGMHPQKGQDTDYILTRFGKTTSAARRKYRVFVERGIDAGKRPELTGGGLIRSLGGWQAAKALMKGNTRIKSDERLLGDSDFVASTLKKAKERLDRRYRLESGGYDLDWLAATVARVLEIDEKTVWMRGKYPESVRARSLLCYWAVRELGYRTTRLSEILDLTQPAVSQSVKRGGELVRKNGYLIF